MSGAEIETQSRIAYDGLNRIDQGVVHRDTTYFDQDCCKNDVLDTALIYPSGTDFNSETWKANSSKRFEMLFDLYHRHLNFFSLALRTGN